MNLKKFYSFMKHALLVVVAITTVGITGCDDDEGEPAPTQTIWEIVEGNTSLTMLEEQLLAAELDGTLSADGEMTLFAPSDAAMTTLLETLGLSDFESISAAVTQQVLEYHIANQEYLAAALTNGATITTMQGEEITVVTTTTGEKTLDTGATSNAKVGTQTRATNGVVHIVDVVLVPPSIGEQIVQTLGTVLQPIMLGSDFTILAEGLVKADQFAATQGAPTLTSILLNQATGFESALFTVFAPTNATFNAANLTAASFTGQQWYGIIAQHIVAGANTLGTTGSFAVGNQITTVANALGVTANKLVVISTSAPTNPSAGIMTGIAIDSNGSNTTAEAQVAVLDVLTATGANPAENGIINVIAGVLRPQ